MPEGDAIFRTARTLHRALADGVVTRFESVFPALSRVADDAPIVGRTVERVDASGKHVLIHFSPVASARNATTIASAGRLVLRTHMRMNGSWHIYRPGERWRRPHRDMRIVVATAAFEAIAFTVPVAEWLFADEAAPRTPPIGGIAVPRSAPTRARPSRLPPLAQQDDLRQIGPDLLGESFDEEEALRRIRARGDEEIADVLLNQRVVAGIGNVYKSEVLFICRINPFIAASAVDEARLREALQTARKLLLANVTTLRGGITTYIGFARGRRGGDADRRYVYGRARRPCRRCATSILVRAQGPYARLTYWCPRCQP